MYRSVTIYVRNGFYHQLRRDENGVNWKKQFQKSIWAHLQSICLFWEVLRDYFELNLQPLIEAAQF